METELKYGYRVDDIEQESKPEMWPSPQRIQCRAVILAVIISKNGDHLVYTFECNGKVKVKRDGLLNSNMRDSDLSNRFLT